MAASYTINVVRWMLTLLAAGALAGPAAAETILVLPFFNHTANKSLDWIGESLAENIREALNSESALTVRREDRQEAYRRLTIKPYSLLTKATVIKIAETLDAHQVIYGQFELEPDPAGTTRGTLRITAQILDLSKISRGPEFRAVGALDDLAALQTHLAWRTLQFILPQTSPSEEEFRKRRPPVRVDAMENYIRGLLSANDDAKMRFFLQAATLDPRFAPPRYEIGRMHWAKEDFRNAADWLAKIGPSDDHFREASFMRGVARFELSDYAGAEETFESLSRDIPLNEVFNNLGCAMLRRNLNGAIESFQKALEGDRNDPVYLFNLGYALWRNLDFDSAVGNLEQALQRDPDDEETKLLLGFSRQKIAPAKNDPKTNRLERLKYEFELSAFLQLRSILEGGKK